MIKKEGEYIEQHNGVISQAPWLKTDRESWHTFIRVMKQLGLGQPKLGRPPDKRHKREKQGSEIEDLLSR